MTDSRSLFQRIKNSVNDTAPGATIVLYGSYVRGDNKRDSDIDILILVDKDKVTVPEVKSITYPLYEIEFDTGIIISPLVLSKKQWEAKHHITPFYENVRREGIIL
ncbi:MAG: nucleotidyltransferase domain-containing protein [Ferruginibacter sp.]